MTTNNRHAEPWWHRGTNQNQPTRMGSAPTKPTSPAARLNSDNRRAQTTNNLVRRRVFRTLTLPPPAQPHPIHPAPIQPSDDDDQDSSPAETLHPPPTLTHQSHRAIPAQSQQCRAQKRRGGVPPEVWRDSHTAISHYNYGIYHKPVPSNLMSLGGIQRGTPMQLYHNTW